MGYLICKNDQKVRKIIAESAEDPDPKRPQKSDPDPDSGPSRSGKSDTNEKKIVFVPQNYIHLCVKK